jgi:hypothetical protein
MVTSGGLGGPPDELERLVASLAGQDHGLAGGFACRLGDERLDRCLVGLVESLVEVGEAFLDSLEPVVERRAGLAQRGGERLLQLLPLDLQPLEPQHAEPDRGVERVLDELRHVIASDVAHSPFPP